MIIKGIDYVFYNVIDMKKSVAFYKDILGLKLGSNVGESWAEFDLGNGTLALGVFGASSNPAQLKNNASVALAVDDIKSSIEYLKGKNVKVTTDVAPFDPCSMAIILDPDNNQIILHQRKDGTVG